jgi:hypothetical protein
MSRILQVLIAADQLLNTMLGGMADETMSARCWRLREYQPYKTLRPIIDQLLYWQPNHCQSAYESELLRSQEPSEYRQPTNP